VAVVRTEAEIAVGRVLPVEFVTTFVEFGDAM
jgi:hypothetical protein